jgi:phage head maturation protease
MQLIVDSAGMGINTYLDTDNNADARALYSAVERGDISGMSFMFGIKGERWEGLDTEHPTRFITDISVVIEVSAVTFPAYDSTEISARGREALESARAVLERARRSRAGAVETVPNDLELLKLKAQLSFMNGGI